MTTKLRPVPPPGDSRLSGQRSVTTFFESRSAGTFANWLRFWKV
jgi:hypothetical protein